MTIQKEDTQEQFVSITIDSESYKVPKWYTLATAISYVKGLNYRKTRFGDPRGPVCNMGICFECTAFLVGKGNVRACMMQVEEGMNILLENDFTKVNQPKEKHKPTPFKDQVQDVVIIGAGPAGLAAAEELSGTGLSITIIDEQEYIGGQIHRHVMHPKEKAKPARLVKNVENLKGIRFIKGNTVWSVVREKSDDVDQLSNNSTMYEIHLDNHVSIITKYLIIATGAHDNMLHFKGWNKPGVMSAGGLQISVKTQKFIPGKSVLLAGSHPFILIVAKEILDQGGKIKGIAFSQSFPKINELLPMGIASLRRWSKSKELISSLQTVRKAKVPIWFNTVPIEAKGNGQINEVTLSKLGKNDEITDDLRFVECDVLGNCYGFNASSELPRHMQCEMKFDELSGGWIVQVNEEMESSLEHIYVAGELTGVGGAELSEVEGRIAGISIIEKTTSNARNQRRLTQLKKERKSWLGFAEMLGKVTKVSFDPTQLLKHHSDTLVCRCEEVSYESIDSVLREHPHLSNMNAVKLMTRCGMGLCQGRYCEQALSTILQERISSNSEQDSFSARFPVKPIIINDLRGNE